MTDISTLGEFGLIRHLTESFGISNPSTIKGIGDDAAVLDYGGKRTLVTTDILLEGVHFNLDYTPLQHLGYKAAIVNFSDIYAMNGQPKQITVTIGVDKRFPVEALEELYSGISIACKRYGVDMVGGDTSASINGLVISITCIGEVAADNVVYRNGAQANDLICVSGELGSAYLGLQMLIHENDALKGVNDVDSILAEHKHIIERQLKPEARGDVIKQLYELGIKPTAMMDISDGLSSELFHICSQSGVGCRIFSDNIPINYDAAVYAEELNLNIVTCALNGGEDYELLFTCNLKDYDKLLQIKDVQLIGHCTKKEEGMVLVGREGEEIALKAQGWNAFYNG